MGYTSQLSSYTIQESAAVTFYNIFTLLTSTSRLEIHFLKCPNGSIYKTPLSLQQDPASSSLGYNTPMMCEWLFLLVCTVEPWCS